MLRTWNVAILLTRRLIYLERKGLSLLRQVFSFAEIAHTYGNHNPNNGRRFGDFGRTTRSFIYNTADRGRITAGAGFVPKASLDRLFLGIVDCAVGGSCTDDRFGHLSRSQGQHDGQREYFEFTRD